MHYDFWIGLGILSVNGCSYSFSVFCFANFCFVHLRDFPFAKYTSMSNYLYFEGFQKE